MSQPAATHRVSLIINADDLGLSEAVNEKIFQLMDEGKLRSASLLMNGLAVDQALSRLDRYPGCSFGVHLNITHGIPLTPPSELQPLLDAEGRLTEGWDPNLLTRSLQEAVFSEWSAQIDKALAAGVNVSHLDSHHHVHRLAPLFSTLTRMQRQYGIRRLRGSWTIFPDAGTGYPYDDDRAWKETRTTRSFTSLSTFMHHFGHGQAIPASTLWELMTHPGSPYDGDSAILQGPWQASLAFPVEIHSFHEL
ncbi:MAG: ChbG/HpnK family deacetylase [Magnetococcales bacterium]|nr:ChbG/HpnK family deacetylase [Magnetococcales bacterium]